MQIFEEVLFLKLRTTTTKKERKKKQKQQQLIQLILCQLDTRRLAEGKGPASEHLTDTR